MTLGVKKPDRTGLPNTKHATSSVDNSAVQPKKKKMTTRNGDENAKKGRKGDKGAKKGKPKAKKKGKDR